MQIGIIGGSFDPPHIGHLLTAIQVKEKLHLDQIWLMPCFQHPFGKKLSDTHHRLAMLGYVENDFLKISDFEVKQKKISYTSYTLRELSRQFPNHQFYWIIGSDQLKNFSDWKNWRKLIRDYYFIIFPRELSNQMLTNEVRKSLKMQSIPKNIIILETNDIIMVTISSSQIRKRVKEKKSILYMTIPQIQQYIENHRLYRK